MRQLDEYGALIHAGRWGVHGVSLPGRVTFAPGNVGFSTFGAPRPMEVIINMPCFPCPLFSCKREGSGRGWGLCLVIGVRGSIFLFCIIVSVKAEQDDVYNLFIDVYCA